MPRKPRNKDSNDSKRNSKIPAVIGIGASAGGLEALQELFRAMPEDTGLAFVVIQHLSPDYRSLMDELLARYTQIPIRIAEDGMPIHADTIYLMPPRMNMNLMEGKIVLVEQNRGLNLPIDIFFTSLAQQAGSNSVGIVLSGTGSDGTRGIRAIKEAGGLVIAQDENSAKFDGMPKSAVSTGLVDYILPPNEIPDALISYIKHPFIRKSKTLDDLISNNADALTKITHILRDHCGLDFSYYKENTIIRRLERRVSINHFSNLESYVKFLNESDKEKDSLYRELLIGVTRFFRDEEAFTILREKVLPKIFSENKEQVRIWSTGCSTGEEVYSVAMTVQEYMQKHRIRASVKIFATDIDRHSLETAGLGYYPESIISDVEPTLLRKYFKRLEQGYQISEEIRKMVVFAVHNLLKDPPFSKLDLLVCRNLFIYLKPEMQQHILSVFYYSLNDQGYLFMGSSESIGEMSKAFSPVDNKWKIYKYKAGYHPGIQNEIRTPAALNKDRDGISPGRNIQVLRREKLLENVLSEYLPPALLVDHNDNVLQIINDINLVTKVQTGRFSPSVYSLMPKEITLYINNILRRMRHEKRGITLENVSVPENLKDKKLNIEGRVISSEGSEYHLIVFHIMDAAQDKPSTDRIHVNMEDHYQNRVEDLEKELQTTRENLQATVEELETSNEELIASNEELQSTNEELQSLNEELYTVNSEYQNKIDELTQLNNDLDNLIRNTEVGALFLDPQLKIRRTTPLVSRVTRILPSDTGRNISDISAHPSYPDLVKDAEHVINTLERVEKQLHLDTGETILVRLRPYRSEYNAVEGVLITFYDISLSKAYEIDASVSRQRLVAAMEIGNLAWWEWDIPSGIVTYDERKATMLGYMPEEFPDNVYNITDLIHPDDHESAMNAMLACLEGKAKEYIISYRIRRKDGGYGWYFDRGSIIARADDGKPLKLLGVVIDISGTKDLEAQSMQQSMLLQRILDNSPMAKIMLDISGKINFANRKCEEIFGLSQEEIIKYTFTSGPWMLTDCDGEPLPSELQPFHIIKKNLKVLEDYRQGIKPKDRELMQLRVFGAPVLDHKGNFNGAVLSILSRKGAE